MGFILLLFLIGLILYAFLAPRLLYFILHVVLIRWLHLAISVKLLWAIVCLSLLPFAIRAFKQYIPDTGGVPDFSSVLNFFIWASLGLFAVSWWFGIPAQ